MASNNIKDLAELAEALKAIPKKWLVEMLQERVDTYLQDPSENNERNLDSCVFMYQLKTARGKGTQGDFEKEIDNVLAVSKIVNFGKQ